MNIRFQPNNMSHVQRNYKRNSNQNQQDARDYFDQIPNENDYHKEYKKTEYHNPKDLSWTQF